MTGIEYLELRALDLDAPELEDLEFDASQAQVPQESQLYLNTAPLMHWITRPYSHASK